MRPVINTRKHFVQFSLFNIAAGAMANHTIITSVVAPAVTSADQVREGSIISSVYVEMWLTSDDALPGTVIVTLEKLPGAANAFMVAGDAAGLNVYDDKKNILHTQMGLLGNDITYPMPAIKGWFKIPKGKQRFGLDDRLVLNIFAQSNGIDGCGFYIFKEQT